MLDTVVYRRALPIVSEQSSIIQLALKGAADYSKDPQNAQNSSCSLVLTASSSMTAQ